MATGRLVRESEMEQSGAVMFHPEQQKWLDKMFPEVIPSPASTPAEMYFQGGARMVVQLVRSRVQR
jgi:hypothetical protein